MLLSFRIHLVSFLRGDMHIRAPGEQCPQELCTEAMPTAVNRPSPPVALLNCHLYTTGQSDPWDSTLTTSNRSSEMAPSTQPTWTDDASVQPRGLLWHDDGWTSVQLSANEAGEVIIREKH